MKDTEKVSDDLNGMRELHEDAVVLLRSVRRTLADLLREVIEGETTPLKDLAGKHGELETALKRVIEAEQKYDERIEREQARGRPDDIDFDAIRAEIGCRLHRLRVCCQSD